MATPANLRQASYRGVVFGVVSTEDDTGRRLSIDSLPGRDLPAVSDFGQDPRNISLDVFVIGADYQERALALVEVCAQRNTPGRLSLPYMASAIVRPVRCVRRESRTERGMARFSLLFVEVEQLVLPARRTSGHQAVDRVALEAAAAGFENMADNLQVELVPSPVLDAASLEVEKIGGVLGALGSVREATEDAVALARKSAELIRDAQALVLEPVLLTAKLSDAIELVISTGQDALASLYAYQTLAALRPNVHANYLMQGNSNLVASAGRTAALGGWARSAARVEWPSYEDAVAARQALEAEIDDLATMASDAEFSALQQLRAVVAQSVPPADKNLPRIRRMTLPRTTSALTLAYRLYDDTSRDQELVERNQVAHPAFIPGSVELEVLASG